MSDGPKEAFPWKPSWGQPDVILDANKKPACILFGFGGSTDSESPGVAERRRMIQELDNLIKLARQVAKGTCLSVEDSITACVILARIEGKQ